jgi:hypothetical protein
MSELESWIAALRAEREKFDAVLSRMSEEHFEVAGVVGDWTVKDVLSHLTVRESRVITLLFQIERGGKAQPLESSLPVRLKQNDKDYVEQKERPLDRVQTDFRGVHVQMLKRVGQMTGSAEVGFFDRRRYATLGGQSLAEYVFANTAAHEEEHRREIEAWLGRA